METGSCADDSVLLATARAACEIGRLPGAPTPDWVTRLAGVLTDADPASIAEVGIVRIATRVIDRRGGSIGADAGDDAAADAADLRRVLRPLAALPDLHGAAVWTLGDSPGAPAAPGRHRVALHRRRTAVAGWAPASVAEASPGHALLLLWDAPDAGRGLGGAALQRMLRCLLPLLAERLGVVLSGPDGTAPWLSACEQRVLDLLAAGLSVPEIAQALGRSQHTVHDHVKRLHRKLGTSTRGSLIARSLGRAEGRRMKPSRGRPMLAFRTDGRCSFVQPSGW